MQFMFKRKYSLAIAAKAGILMRKIYQQVKFVVDSAVKPRNDVALVCSRIKLPNDVGLLARFKCYQYLMLGFMLFLFTGLAFAATADQTLASLLKKYNAYAASFKQTTFDSSNMIINSSSGNFMFQRPGKFRWHTLKPSEQIIIANNDTLWIYDVDLQQVTKRKINKQAAFNPAELLTGKISILQKNFNIKAHTNNGRLIFQLTPKNKQVNFQQVNLEFDQGLLMTMQVVNNLGQTSVFTFTQIQLNPKLNSSLFDFKAPKGVDVLQQ
jgi:outer membrane lipoprotein carrier protein